MSPDQLHEPWRSFLHDLDAALTTPTELHCLGGFIAAELYGLRRPTADVDVLEAIGTSPDELMRLAGPGSGRHRRYRVHLQMVGGIASVPEDYQSRLVDLCQGTFRKLRVRALEKHDLVLAKLPRNSDRDREDFQEIARNVGLDADLLRDRYHDELRLHLSNPARDDLTLDLWLDILKEVADRRSEG